jgi:drug/metabolite transporter (DMT)-like permease
LGDGIVVLTTAKWGWSPVVFILSRIVLNPKKVLDNYVNAGKIEKIGRQTQAPGNFFLGGGVGTAGACFLVYGATGQWKRKEVIFHRFKRSRHKVMSHLLLVFFKDLENVP